MTRSATARKQGRVSCPQRWACCTGSAVSSLGGPFFEEGPLFGDSAQRVGLNMPLNRLLTSSTRPSSTSPPATTLWASTSVEQMILETPPAASHCSLVPSRVLCAGVSQAQNGLPFVPSCNRPRPLTLDVRAKRHAPPLRLAHDSLAVADINAPVDHCRWRAQRVYRLAPERFKQRVLRRQHKQVQWGARIDWHVADEKMTGKEVASRYRVWGCGQWTSIGGSRRIWPMGR